MGGMDFSGGSTYSDLGQGAVTRPQSMQRKLSAHKLGTQVCAVTFTVLLVWMLALH